MKEDEEPVYFTLFGLTFPIYKKLIIQLTLLIWLSLCVILFLAQTFFAYEMTTADIPGGLVSGALLAYLITLLIK